MNNSAQRPVTMKDLARVAGVNPSTISRALRGDRQVSEETRDEIRALAQKMGYRPNPFMQAFTAHVRSYRRLPQHAALAVLHGWPVDYELFFLKGYLEGIRHRANELGYHTELFELARLDYKTKRLSQILRTRNIHGLVVLPVPGGLSLDGLNFDEMAAASIDYSLERPLLHRAAPDYFQNMNTALHELEARGYKRIGFCTYREELARISRHWLGAYTGWQAAGRKGHKLPPHINPFSGALAQSVIDVERQAKKWAQHRDTFARWLDAHQPDAVVTNDGFFYLWLRELGYSVPEEVAFAALGRQADDIPAAGIEQHAEAIGAAAVDLVLEQIHRNDFGIPRQEKTVLLEGSWQEGQTVRARKDA